MKALVVMVLCASSFAVAVQSVDQTPMNQQSPNVRPKLAILNSQLRAVNPNDLASVGQFTESLLQWSMLSSVAPSIHTSMRDGAVQHVHDRSVVISEEAAVAATNTLGRKVLGSYFREITTDDFRTIRKGLLTTIPNIVASPTMKNGSILHDDITPVGAFFVGTLALRHLVMNPEFRNNPEAWKSQVIAMSTAGGSPKASFRKMPPEDAPFLQSLDLKLQDENSAEANALRQFVKDIHFVQ